MHELKLACGIVDTVLEAVESASVSRVRTVSVRVGGLAGVAVEALRFGFEIAARGTILEDSKLLLDEEFVMLNCLGCGDSRLTELQFCCPTCGQPGRLCASREVVVESIEVV